MRTIRMGLAVAGALLAAGGTTAAEGAGGRGQVTKGEQTWTVADVIAWREDDKVAVVFASVPFDRTAMAKDGRIDSFDFIGIAGNTLTVNLRSDGPGMCFDYAGESGGGSSCSSAYQSAVQVTRNDTDRVAGRVDWSEGEATVLQLEFDLPVLSEVARPGRPLPADGGEPGRAVLAHFAAIASADLARIKAVSHPERVAMMDAETEADLAEMLGFLKAMSPTEVRIAGGTVDGDSAYVDYAGKRDGEALRGTAELARVDGRWYVTGTSTRN